MFYNQRFIRPNEKAIRQRLANYGNYIAKNSKCKIELNYGKEHGLFGDIGKTGVKDIDSLEEAVQYILDKSTKDRVNIYHGLISLSRDEIKKSDFTSRKKWENLIATKMYMLAKENNIKIQNLEWVAAYHIKKKQSHCHVMFWDKNEGIKSPYIPKPVFEKKMERLRKEFAKDICKDDFSCLYKIQDEAMSELESGLASFFNDDISEKEVERLKKMFYSTSVDLSEHDMINPYFTRRQLGVVVHELLRIKELLPKKGSLKYGYQTEDVKKEIDKAVEKIIASSRECKKAYDKYVQSAVDIRKIYSPSKTSVDEAKSEAIKNINRSVGNKIFKAIKELNKIETRKSKNDISEESEKIQKDNVVSTLLTQIAFSLSRGGNSNQAKVHTIVNDDLSKQAKIDLAKKLENKGIDWGQYGR